MTSDAATIIREIEVVHPAAKLLVMASEAQESEMGDATNLVLILAGELLKRAESLLVMGLHPSEIILGYEMAVERARSELQESLVLAQLPTPLPTASQLAACIQPALTAKQPNVSDLLSKLVAEASLAVMPTTPKDFNVDAIRIVKVLGGGVENSRVVRGMVFGKEPEGNIKQAKDAKVAVFSCGLDIAQTETKGTVLLKKAEDLLDFSRGEEKQLEGYIKEIADSGVKIVIAGGGVGDLALHYLNRFDIAVIKIVSKFDLRRLCKVVGATPLARLGAPMAEEAGHVDVFETIEIGGDRVTVFRQDSESGRRTRTATIVLRGATANHLDDLERSLDDGINTVRILLRDPRLVPGAGATEIELAKRITQYGERTPGLSQHAIRKWAEAMEIIPKTLAENAGLNGEDTVSALYKAHHEQGIDAGVDINGHNDGVVASTVERSIMDPWAAKDEALKLATSAAVSILKVDSIIVSKQAGINPPVSAHFCLTFGLYLADIVFLL